MDVATLLTECRRRSGMSQRELARVAETSAAAVCLYERGERVPRVDTLTRLIAATGFSLQLSTTPPAKIDVAQNARTLEDLLDLVDRLPQRSARQLKAPTFARLARRERQLA